MQRIYLDHNATTPVHPAVLEAMLPYFGAEFGNPSSVHQFGQRASHAIEQARESVAALIGARSSEIVFTSGGTEADNTAIFGVIGDALRGAKALRAAPPHLITTVIEHDAVLNSCRALEGRGISVTCIPVDAGGIVSPDAIRAAIRPETALISVMYANNEIGTLQPIEEIAQEIARTAAEARIPLHTDAVQAAGKIAIDVNRLGVQLLLSFGAQVLWTQRRRRALRAQGRGNRSSASWRAQRAQAPRRNRKCCRNCGFGQGR